MAPWLHPEKGSRRSQGHLPPPMMCRTPSDSDSGLAWDSENMEEMQAQKSPRLMGLGGSRE